jgi:hypothetical protein
MVTRNLSDFQNTGVKLLNPFAFRLIEVNKINGFGASLEFDGGAEPGGGNFGKSWPGEGGGGLA